jgi:hypothetical protein
MRDYYIKNLCLNVTNYFYLIELGVQGTLELHVRDEVSSLALVGSDDPDLVRLHPGL